MVRTSFRFFLVAAILCFVGCNKITYDQSFAEKPDPSIDYTVEVDANSSPAGSEE